MQDTRFNANSAFSVAKVDPLAKFGGLMLLFPSNDICTRVISLLSEKVI